MKEMEIEFTVVVFRSKMDVSLSLSFILCSGQ